MLTAINQPSTSRLNENLNPPENNDTSILCRSLDDAEIAKQVSANDKVKFLTTYLTDNKMKKK